MTEKVLLGKLRSKIGNPPTTEVTLAELQSHVADALDWLAETLRFRVVTDEQAILLVEDQREYPLPTQMIRLIWAEWNTNRLTPTSTYRNEREGSNWRSVSSANPSEYAIEGRNLLLIPPPSDDAISTAGTIALRYIAAPDEMGPDGDASLWQSEYQLVIHKAAIRWLQEHPSQENALRIQEYKTELEELLGPAKRRRMNPHDNYQPGMAVSTNRQGAAR